MPLHAGSEPGLELILERACPSIRYRLRREVLLEDPAAPEMAHLQAMIMEDDLVREVATWKAPDGWLAWHFHGTKSMEAGLRILCEKGVEPERPLVNRALEALAHASPERLERGIGRVSPRLEERGLGGSAMIRSGLFALAGQENQPCVREQINRALAAFRSAGEIPSHTDAFEERNGRMLLRENVPWPGIYELRLLAYTQSWRSTENLEIIRRALVNLVRLSPLPAYHIKYGSQLIAPASFAMLDFNPDLDTLDESGWMLWFLRMELLARLGVLPQITPLAAQADRLRSMLGEGAGFFTRRLTSRYFHIWGSYTGLALEGDWRQAQRRINDLTFRSLLILHYTAQGPSGWVI